MPDDCAGDALKKTPLLQILDCPECGEELEMFSTDEKVTCTQCGFIVSGNKISPFKNPRR